MASPSIDRRLGLIGNVAIKAPVVAVATANITQRGEQTIDGIAVKASNAAGIADRVLCVGQTDSTKNGIWDVSLTDWTRSIDADGNYDFKSGTLVNVGSGTTNGQTAWSLSAADPVVPGSSLMSWAKALWNTIGAALFLQAGTGAVGRGLQDKLRDWVCVLDFGAATGATATTNTAAIQAAADYCTTNGYRLQGAPGTFAINGQITLHCNGDLSEMTLSAPGNSLTGAAVFVGGSGSTLIEQIDLKLPNVDNSDHVPSSWVGSGTHPGIEIGNLYHSKVQVNYIHGFVVGLDCGGYGDGCALNTIEVAAYLQNNKIGMRGQPKASTGWFNDNLILGLNSRIDSAYGTAVAGTRNLQLLPFDLTDATTSWPNNNVFQKPCVEGNAPEFHIEVAGADNTFVNPRLETTGGVTQKIRLTGHATLVKTVRNFFVSGFLSTTQTYSSSGIVTQCGYAGPAEIALETAGTRGNLMLVNQGGSSVAQIMGFSAGTFVLGKSDSSTDWSYRISAFTTKYKSPADVAEKIGINHTGGTLSFGDGTAAPTKSISGVGAGLRVASDWHPDTTATFKLGNSSLRWLDVYGATFHPGDGSPIWTSGTLTPEGAVTAVVGSLFTRTDGGGVTTLYVKETGSGNTGWVAK